MSFLLLQERLAEFLEVTGALADVLLVPFYIPIWYVTVYVCLNWPKQGVIMLGSCVVGVYIEQF